MKEIFAKAYQYIEEAEFEKCFEIIQAKDIPSSFRTQYAIFRKTFIAGKQSVFFDQELRTFIKDIEINITSNQTLNKTLNLCILSTTKENIVCDKKFKHQISATTHHEIDCSLWKPFEDENSIKEIIEEYKTKVDFEVKERFLENDKITPNEKANFLKNILIVDPFALHTENLKIARSFDYDKVGACFVLLCQSVSFELFDYIRTQIQATFGDLHACFLDYKEKYIHYIFPIKTKELFFRALSNVALLRLNISSQIKGLDTNDTIRSQKFKF